MPAREVERALVMQAVSLVKATTAFCDRRAMKLNDLVTVIINETASASSSGKKDLSET
jgi:flagellar L-ring protein precursor FlgH